MSAHHTIRIRTPSLRRWILVAICCVHALVIAATNGLGHFASLRTSAARATIIFLPLTLASPVGMGLIMRLICKDMKGLGQSESRWKVTLRQIYGSNLK